MSTVPRDDNIPAQEPFTEEARHLADFIQAHAPLFVLTGAGCSTASGIPDYRDDNGDWKHSRPVQFSDFTSSSYTRRRYWARSLIGWPRVERSTPNPAHRALAALEIAGLVSTLCTQNVDGLHHKAGSAAVIDLHGRLDEVECLECGATYSRAEIQRRLGRENPGYDSTESSTAPDGDVVLEGSFKDFVLVHCDRCGGLLKPSVVFFGESVPAPRVAQAMRALEESRGMLVVGSSLMVYSGYRFCRFAEKLGTPIAAVNRGKTRADPLLALKISGDCGAVLDRVAELLALNRG